MKKIYLSLIIGILLFGTITAVTLSNKSIKLSKEAKAFYKDKGISITYGDYEDETFYWRCLKSSTDFNLPCSNRFKLPKNEAMIDEWTIETLEKIAQTYLEKEKKSKPTKTDEGDLTIT